MSELPEGEVEDEWIAYNVFEIIEYTKLFAKFITNSCACQTMTVGSSCEYTWPTDSGPQSQSAATYVNNVMLYATTQLENKKLFPVEPGAPFTKQFRLNCGQILRRILRVYMHTYLNHPELVVENKLEDAFAKAIGFLLIFGKRFALLDQIDLEPIKAEVGRWCVIF